MVSVPLYLWLSLLTASGVLPVTSSAPAPEAAPFTFLIGELEFHGILPVVVPDPAGGQLIAWKETTRGRLADRCMAQRFDHEGKPASEPFPLLQSWGKWCYRHTAVASLGADRFAVAAACLEESHEDLCLAIHRWQDVAEVVTLKIRLERRPADLFSPTLLPLPSGDFWLIWTQEDDSGRRAGLWARKFNAEGESLSATVPLSEAGAVEPARKIAASTLPKGQWAVTWTRWQDSRSMIRLFNPDGSRAGPQRILSEPESRGIVHALCSTGGASLLALWADRDRAGSLSTWIQPLSDRLEPVAPAREIKEGEVDGSVTGMSDLACSSRRALVVWNQWDPNTNTKRLFVQSFDHRARPRSTALELDGPIPGYPTRSWPALIAAYRSHGEFAIYLRRSPEVDPSADGLWLAWTQVTLP